MSQAQIVELLSNIAYSLLAPEDNSSNSHKHSCMEALLLQLLRIVRRPHSHPLPRRVDEWIDY